MAVSDDETKRTNVLNSVASVGTRSWTRGQFSFVIANPQIRVLNGSRVLSADVTVTRAGATIFDDRVNMPNPATAVRDSSGNPQNNPLQALRDTLFDVVNIITKGGSVARLQRNADGSFRGDSLAVRSATADGDVSSSNGTFATMCTGSGLSAATTGTTSTPRWSLSGATYQGRETFIDFDTSTIADPTIITAAVVTLYGSGTPETDSADNYNLEARYKDWGGTVTTADWFDPRSPTWNALVSGGSIDVGSWNQTAGTANNLSDSGVYTSISKSGTTRFVVGYSGMNSSTPANINEVEFRTADQAGTTSDPLFTVTYTTIPVVLFGHPDGAHGAQLMNQIIVQ